MTERRKLTLIANPAASQFTGGVHREVLSRLRQAFEVTSEWPQSAEAVTDVAADAAARGDDLVVAMGGDGVINRVINGIAQTSTALGIIPVGTTNVLAEILGVDPDPVLAAEQLAAAESATWTRLVRVTLDDEKPRLATFAVGVGFDAEVVQRAEQTPHRKLFMGGVHYAITTAKVLWSRFRKRLPTLRVECAAGDWDASLALAQVHWPYTYFGRMPLALTGNAPEGGIHIAGFDQLKIQRIPRIAFAALRGSSWAQLKGGFLAENQPQATIHADPPALVQADGDVIGEAERITIEVIENGVLVYLPVT